MRLEINPLDEATEQELIAMETKKSRRDRQARWQVNFFTIWTGQAFSLLGSQLVQFALIWWLTKTTGSATVLAMASLVGLLPQVLLGPFIGALVDRWNRRLTMIAADSVIALATLGLAFLFLTGNAQIWHVYLLMFIRAVASGFHWPAMQASTSLMIPKEHLTRIQGINQLLNGGMSIVAAPLGALLLDLLPLQGVLAIDVITALIAILPLIFIPIPQPERTLASDGSAGERPSLLADLGAGLRYVWAWPSLVLIMVMAMVINFTLNPGFSLLPLLVTEHFQGQSWHFATLESLSGIGIIAGGLTLGAWGGFRRRLFTSFMGLIMIGVGCLIIGLAPSSAFILAAIGMLVMGFAMPITNGPLLAAVQATVHPEMQGRVFTLINSGCGAMMPLGMIIAGPVADAVGVQSWFVLGGVVTVLMGITGFFIPAFAHFEDGQKAAAADREAVERGEDGVRPGLAPTTGD